MAGYVFDEWVVFHLFVFHHSMKRLIAATCVKLWRHCAIMMMQNMWDKKLGYLFVFILNLLES
jgi:hypothetical protein